MADRHAHDGFHQHEHAHPGAPVHRHPHHHRAETPVHAHAHPTSFESLTYIVSPVHALDARAKIGAALVLVVGIVTTAPLRPVEFALLVALLGSVGMLARVPLGRILVRTVAVLPVAGAIALLAPLQSQGGSWSGSGTAGGWLVAWGLLSKAWLSACCMLLLAATTPTVDLLSGLRRLRVPEVFVMLLSFIARYVSVLLDQLRSLRVAVASRAPVLKRGVLVSALGGIAGNLFVRSYERGERVHAAMLSRGFTGTLPAARAGRMRPADVLAVTCALLAAVALALY